MASGRDGDNKSAVGGEGKTAISALELLRQDHQDVEAFFAEYEKAGSRGAKEATAAKICLALQVHAQIEEEIFYPAARQAISDKQLIDEAIVEHDSAKKLIAEIEVMEEGDQLLDAKVKVLEEQIRHHVEEEEQELFPKIEQSKLDIAALGRRLADRKAALLHEIEAGAEPA
jgi:iron-sulfur cluster repair protein YtfE (RIC family)